MKAHRTYMDLSSHSAVFFNVLISGARTLKKTESDFVDIRVKNSKTSK